MSKIACLLLLERQDPPSVQDPLFDSLVEACGRFTPQIALRNREAIFLEIGKCRGLHDPRFLELQLISLAKRFGWRSRVAIAETPSLALVRARFRRRSEPSNPPDLLAIPLEGLHDLATPFHADPEIRKKIDLMIQVLKSLGLKNVAEFVAIPPSTLASRFGQEGVELSARARGESPMQETAWPGFHPSPDLFEKSQIENSENLEALLFVLRGCIDRAVARLRGRAERASVIEVEFEFPKWSTLKSTLRTFQVSLPIPQGSVQGILPILHEHLSRALEREPLEAPVEALVFRVSETVPGHGPQRDFFTKKEEEAEIWDSLVGRLSLKLGKNQVFVAKAIERYRPECGFIRCELSEFDRSLEVSPPIPWPQHLFFRPAARPSRIFKRPQRLRRIGQRLVDSESGRHWKVSDWQGPERLSGEWWMRENPGFIAREPSGFDRDYYRVTTVTGELLWIFVNRDAAPRAEHSLYLHGYFD